jgi:hypothetical protein
MFRSQFSDHHQGSINRTCAINTYQRACFVVLQYVAVCCLYIYAYDVPVRVVSDYVPNQTPRGQLHRMYRRTDNIQPHTRIRRCTHADKY